MGKVPATGEPKASRRLRAMDYVWGLLVGLVGLLVSTVFPQATVQRNTIVGIVVCVVLLAVFRYWPFISSLIGSPTFVFKLEVGWRAPVWAGKAKLKRDLARLSTDFHGHIRDKPSGAAEFFARSRAKWQQAVQETDPKKQREIAHQSFLDEVEAGEREERDLAEHGFASRLNSVLIEFARRGLLDQPDVFIAQGSMEFKAGGGYKGMMDVITNLQAIANRRL
jgi:hypothetical protein